MKYVEGKYMLSSGRVIRANLGVLGLTNDGSITQGYDGIVEQPGESEWNDDHVPLTREERAEIAEHVRAWWADWASYRESK